MVPHDLACRDGVPAEDATVIASVGPRGLQEAVHARKVRLLRPLKDDCACRNSG